MSELLESAKLAVKNGVNIKTVLQQLNENGFKLVAWTNSGGRTYMAVQSREELEGIEFEPNRNQYDRGQFEWALQGIVVEI